MLIVRAGEGVERAARALLDQLRANDVRAELDDRADVSAGRRIVDWELRGVPLRIELGPRDLAAGQGVVARRVRGGKGTLELARVAAAAPRMLEEDQALLLREARELRDRMVESASSVEEAAELSRHGIARIPWPALGIEREATLAASGASVRCLVARDGRGLVDDPQDPAVDAIVGRAY